MTVEKGWKEWREESALQDGRRTVTGGKSKDGRQKSYEGDERKLIKEEEDIVRM